MASLKHLAEIENLKAVFYQVLRREVARERGDLGALLIEDFVRAAEGRQTDARTPDEPSEADINGAFRVLYPEYFAQSGASANACHQRFVRARADVRALLQAVAN